MDLRLVFFLVVFFMFFLFSHSRSLCFFGFSLIIFWFLLAFGVSRAFVSGLPLFASLKGCRSWWHGAV